MLSACSPFPLLNAAGFAANPNITVTRDIAYGEGDRHELDVYAPPGNGSGRPTVVFFYGGGWDSGARADYAWVGRGLAARGYVAVIADYRLYPQVVWPAFLQDSADVVRWSHDHIAAYGGDPSRLFLMGHSAGAYNAVELAVDRRWLAAMGMDPAQDIRGAIGLSGPYDFLPLHSEELKIIFGPENHRPDNQPINHVDGLAPPLLLATGDLDRAVDPGNSDRLAARVRAAGGAVTVIHYPKLNHMQAVAALLRPLEWLAPVMRDATAFIDRHAGAESARATPGLEAAPVKS